MTQIGRGRDVADPRFGLPFHFHAGWLVYRSGPSQDMIERLQRALDRGSGSTEYGECRRCGTTVSDDDGRCPDCGSDDNASYTF